MGDRVWPVALISAVVVAAVLAVVPADDDGERPDPDAVAVEFLAAYERSRTATFAVDQRFSRTVAGRGELAYDRRLVQRPPDDRLVVGGGSADGRLDGRVVRCTDVPGGTGGCLEGPPAGDYRAEVDAELAELRRLVTGADPVYELASGSPGCWSLHLRLDVLTPPYGERAGFCFDAATGAPTRIEIHREGAIDVVEAVEVRADVTAADLRIGDLGDLPGG